MGIVICVIGLIWVREGRQEIFCLMWDRRVVRIEECVGNFVVACSFRCVIENFE
jgi:hypothetical protein